MLDMGQGGGPSNPNLLLQIYDNVQGWMTVNSVAVYNPPGCTGTPTSPLTP
jgi:hypothetical protein